MRAMCCWKISEASPSLCGEKQNKSLCILSGGKEKASNVVMGGWGLLQVLVFQGIAPCCTALLATGCKTEACSELSYIAQLVLYSKENMGHGWGFYHLAI